MGPNSRTADKSIGASHAQAESLPEQTDRLRSQRSALRLSDCLAVRGIRRRCIIARLFSHRYIFIVIL